MSNFKPISVAIVGRPNVGKSTLFNRIIKERRAIETAEAGTTRDRLYGEYLWRGKSYQIVDTAGILARGNDEVEAQAQKSTQIALEEAKIILFVVDFRAGVNDLDMEIAKKLHRHPRVILVINKSENRYDEEAMGPFRRLGFSKMILVSAISGRNSGDLLDMVDELSAGLVQEKPQQENLKQFDLSIIGRPNAGKSTLLNTIIGEEKMIVSGTAGTTRDSQKISFDHKGYRINLVDTAGIRRKSKVPLGSIEGYALMRSYQAMKSSDMLIYLLDAESGIVAIDQSILGEAKDSGRSIVLAVNKIDLWEDKESEMAKFIAKLQIELNFMPWLPVVFISAKDKTNVSDLLNQCVKIIEQRSLEISNEECAQILAEAKERNSQIEYITSLTFERCNPIVFKVCTKRNKKPHFSHLRYLENRIRDVYPLPGNPIFIDWLR